MQCQKIPHNLLKLRKKGLAEYLHKFYKVSMTTQYTYFRFTFPNKFLYGWRHTFSIVADHGKGVSKLISGFVK
jgi:hypothetical protein